MPRPIPRSLAPPIDLPAPPSLVHSISERYWLLRHEKDSHPLFKMSQKQWERRVAKLANAAKQDGPEGDHALIELCTLDPRFIATDLAVAKMLDWELQVVFADVRSAKHSSVRTAKASHDEAIARKDAEERRRQHQIRAQTARDNLTRLGKAIATATGKGNKGYHLRQQLRQSFAFYTALFTELRKQLRAKFTDEKVRKLAQAWDLPEKQLRKLKGSARVEGLADEQLATEYGISAGRVRAMRTERSRKK